MSVVNNPRSPMYVPEEKRRIARQRAKKLVDMISDYSEAREKIPDGFKCHDQCEESKKRILKVLGGTAKEWDDWKWQLKNSIRDVSVLAKIISLSDQEIKNIEKTETQYRWSVSPYFASLMDPEDRNCPIRKQSVPTIMNIWIKM